MRLFQTVGLFVGLAFFIESDAAYAAPPDEAKPGVHLTIYNDNFALVKDRRELPDVFKAGINLIQFRDVAATLDATSVHFRSLTDPAAQVVEQNYEFDLGTV